MSNLTDKTDDVVERGETIYENKLRFELETPENKGKTLVIDVDTGEYVLDADPLKAMLVANEKFADDERYIMKVGFNAFGAIGGTIKERER